MDQHNHILKAQLQRKMLKIIRFRYLQTHGTGLYTTMQIASLHGAHARSLQFAHGMVCTRTGMQRRIAPCVTDSALPFCCVSLLAYKQTMERCRVMLHSAGSRECLWGCQTKRRVMRK